MAKKIEPNDLYELSSYVADLLKDYGAIRYLDSDEIPHILLVVDEQSIGNMAFHTDRLVRLNFEFVTVEKETVNE